MAAYTTIDNPELYFQTKLYSGDGSTDVSHTFDGSEDMQANLIWFKRRNGSANHFLYDSVRGANRSLVPNDTDVEATSGEQTTFLSSFDSDGFTLGDDSNNVNGSGQSYALWAWKESATAGFDIVTYTGTGSAKTENHSLSAKPEFFVVKSRTFGEQWECYHKSLGATKCMQWDDDSAEADIAGRFNDTEPTTSVFTVGDADAVNKNTYTYVTYLWRSVQGVSKIGKYKGTGNANGTFIYTGFRPAWVFIKKTSGSDNWILVDNKRDGYNGSVEPIYINLANAEATAEPMDLLSNGFKMLRTDGGENASGATYIYMAFAEQPFVNSNGAPANAR